MAPTFAFLDYDVDGDHLWPEETKTPAKKCIPPQCCTRVLFLFFLSWHYRETRLDCPLATAFPRAANETEILCKDHKEKKGSDLDTSDFSSRLRDSFVSCFDRYALKMILKGFNFHTVCPSADVSKTSKSTIFGNC